MDGCVERSEVLIQSCVKKIGRMNVKGMLDM